MSDKCPCPCEVLDAGIAKVIPGETSTFGAFGLTVELSYGVTGSTAKVSVNILNPDNVSFWASSDYFLEHNAVQYKSKIALWLDESNIAYVASGSQTEFTGLQPGKTYRLHLGYILRDGSYATNPIYITTWECKAGLVRLESCTVTCKLTTNYAGSMEWWSDQNPEVRTTEITDSVEIIENITSRPYITIYAQIAGMPDTRTEVPKIYIPLLYSGLDYIISGTTAKIKPLISKDTDYVGSSWSMEIREANSTISNPWERNSSDGATAIFKELSNATKYTGTLTIRYNSPDDVAMNYINVFNFSFKTYGCKVVRTVEVSLNGAVFEVSQTPGMVNDEVLPSVPYWGFVVKDEDMATGKDPMPNTHGTISIDSNICTVDDLEPYTDYRFYIYLDSTKVRNASNEADAGDMVTFSTPNTVAFDTFSTTVTGKSLAIRPNIASWNAGQGARFICNIGTSPSVALQSKLCTLIPGELVRSINFDGLLQGTRYYIWATEAYDHANNELDIPLFTATTYGLKVNVLPSDVHSRYLNKVVLNYTDGLTATGASQDANAAARCVLMIAPYTDNPDDAFAIIPPITVDMTGYTTKEVSLFENAPYLQPDTKYTVWSYINGISHSGENDTLARRDFKTQINASNIRYDINYTATTATITLDWDTTPIIDYEISVALNLINSKGETIDSRLVKERQSPELFTGLVSGERYTVAVSAVDSDTNTTDDNITFGEGFDPIDHFTTYQLVFDQISTSTRGLEWVLGANQDIPVGTTYKWWLSCNNQPVIADKTTSLGRANKVESLTHDSALNLHVEAYLPGVEETDLILDSLDLRTKILSVKVDGFKAHLDGMDLTYSAYANSDEIVKDAITNDQIQPVMNECTAWESGIDEYLFYAQSEDTTTRTVGFRGLYSDTEYKFVLAVSDGVNTVHSEPFSGFTNMSLVHLYDASERKWVDAIPYIFHNNRFIKASSFIYSQHKWRETI